MLCDFEWFQSTVSGLSDDSNRIQLLSDLKIQLSALNKSKILLVSHSLPLNDVFDCLNSSERDQVVLASDVLTTLLSPLELGILLGQYGGSLYRALAHPVPKVKEMVIKVLLEITSGDEMVLRLCQEKDLLLAIVDCISHEEMSVANAAIKLMVKLGKTPVGQGVIFTNPILQRLKNVMAQDGVIRFRVYEIGVDLAVNSRPGLDASDTSGLLAALLGELQGGDVLLQLNTIDLLTKLALCTHGLEYLENKGIFQSLATTLASIRADPLSAFLQPGLIKFFGNVTQARPEEVFTSYPKVIEVIFDTVDDPDLIIRGIALETIGYIGTTVNGKRKLNAHKKMRSTLEKIGLHIKTLATEWRIQALNVLANLVQLSPVELDQQTMQITRAWFEQFSAEPLEVVAAICKLPFPELQLAGLHVMQAIANQPWAQAKIHSTPGIIEFLTNRSNIVTKACKEAKFRTIEIITETAGAEDVFGSEVIRQLKQFVKQGPYYVRTVTEVNIENVAA